LLFTQARGLKVLSLAGCERLQRLQRMEENKASKLELNDFSHINTEDLQVLLQTALEEEDYEKASRIIDELNERQ
jgi:hypothetical protein